MSSMFGGGFKASKCKTLLRLAMARIKLLRNKRDIQVKQMRKDIAQLLQTGQEPSARIRVEHIAREQNIMAAYDILELFCELIIVRLPIIEAQKVCPMDLKEAVSSVIFASPRCADLPELLQIRALFTSKYGKEFVAAAAELRPECGVNRRIIEKLSVRAPPGEAKLKLLTEIAAEFKVDWDPADTEAELLKRPEDLLDGPKQFYGASSAPLPDAPHVSASVNGSNSLSQKAPTAPAQPPPPPPPPPSAPSAPAPIQMLPLDQSSSDEDSSPEIKSNSKPQFIPFVVPHPSKRAPVESPPKSSASRSTTTNVASTSGKYDSQKSTSRVDPYSQARKEGRMDYEKPVNYENVAAAAQAAAESANRAVAAARAAAQLAKSQESSPSPPLSRRASLQPQSDSDEEESEEEQPRKTYDRRRQSTKSTGEPTRRERRDSLPKRSDSENSRSDGASLNRRTVEEEKEFSFRMTPQEDRKGRIAKSSNSEDRDEPSLWRSNSGERQEGSYGKGSSEDRKESVRRSNSDDRQEVLFRRNSSGDRGIFSNTAEEQQESTSWKRGAERRAEYDVEPPKKVDPENESFWKPAEQDHDWRSSAEARKIDSGIFTGDEDMEYQRKSGLSRMNDHGRYGDGAYTNASSIFSRTDSAESTLFKRSDSAEVDLRSSDESFYDSKPGFATPKFDDEDYSSSHRNLRLSSTRSDEDPFKRNSSTAKISSPTLKPSFNDFWRAESLAHRTPEEDESFVKKFSFNGREDMKPLEKAKSDTLFETAAEASHAVAAESIDRAGSVPLYTRSFTGEEGRPPKHESTVPTKSRRTRGHSSLLNRDKPEDGGSVGSPVRRSRTHNQDSPPRSHSPSTFDDSSPPLKHSLTYKTPPSNSSSTYQSPDTQRESSPPTTLTGSASGSSNTSPGSVHPKLPDIDDLTARFEALKAAKR